MGLETDVALAPQYQPRYVTRDNNPEMAGLQWILTGDAAWRP